MKFLKLRFAKNVTDYSRIRLKRNQKYKLNKHKKKILTIEIKLLSRTLILLKLFLAHNIGNKI